VPLLLLLALLLGLAPRLSVAVGLPEMEELELAAEEGLPVPEPLTVVL
jgi:hypothetical protein